MIIVEIVEAGITWRSTNMGRPGRPLWTSNRRSFEGSTITVSANPKLLSFVGFADHGMKKYYPKALVLLSNIQTGLRAPESRASRPSDEPEESFSGKSLGHTRGMQTTCHATAPNMGRINTRAQSRRRAQRGAEAFRDRRQLLVSTLNS